MFPLLCFHVISIVLIPGSTLQPLKNVCVCVCVWGRGGGGGGVRLFRNGFEYSWGMSKALRTILKHVTQCVDITFSAWHATVVSCV